MRLPLSSLTVLLVCANLFCADALAAAPGDSTDMAEPDLDVPADTPPDHASPSVCVVILGRLEAEAAGGRAKADAARLEAAAKTFRQKAVALYDGDEGAADQMIGSSVSFYDELTSAQLSAAADMCLAAVDRTFTADE